MDRKKAGALIIIVVLCAFIYWAFPSSPPAPTEALKTAEPKAAKARPRSVTKAKNKPPVQEAVSESAPAIETPPDNASARAREQIQRRDSVADREVVKTESKGQERGEGDQKSPEQKAQELDRRVQDFKQKYEWDDPATGNMAEHAINMIPKQFRDSGITAMIKNLDEAQQAGTTGKVDELMLMQSVEKIIPEEYRAAFQRNMEQYKAEQH